MNYTCYTNVDARFGRPYEAGDRLVRGWSDDVSTPLDDGRTVDTVLEAIFARHNRDDRPDGRMCPSMSIGDVIVLGEVAYSVDHFGFVEVRPDPADLITCRTWREVVS